VGDGVQAEAPGDGEGRVDAGVVHQHDIVDPRHRQLAHRPLERPPGVQRRHDDADPLRAGRRYLLQGGATLLLRA
jgi:hypothetical protein